MQELQAHGLRATPQRQAILAVITACDGPLTAEEIYQAVIQQNPRVSLATVYRTLAVLKEAGLVEQHYFARDHSRSHFRPAGEPEHFHFTCLACGRTIEFQTRQVETLRQELHGECGVEVVQACVCLTGYCPDCRRPEPVKPS